MSKLDGEDVRSLYDEHRGTPRSDGHFDEALQAAREGAERYRRMGTLKSAMAGHQSMGASQSR